MPPTSHDPNQLLTQLEAAKNLFGPGAAANTSRLLGEISKLQLDDPRQLIRLHEALLFLRAFPQSRAVVVGVESLLNTFHERVERIRALRADLSLLDDFDTSGIAGSSMQDTLSFDVARWLVGRVPRNVEIVWDDYVDDYPSERARGTIWPRFIPLLEEDADVEANIPWKGWLDAARGKQRPLEFLLGHFGQLPLPDRARAELYDALRLPLRWNLDNLKLSRTRKWTRPRRFYFHDSPLLQRNQVSLADEAARPAPKLEKLSRRDGESVMHAIREIMLVRYRELYGTTLGDPGSVVRADLGRGVVIHLWNLPPSRRLPLRAYVAGFTLKNGVPINYIEAIGLCEWIEVGFNTFYTYRQGETAWIYAQALRCLNAFTGATTISVYPYQIGQNNDEAIDSGAFWFYRKLGFRSGRADLQKLCEREEAKIDANPKYRTPPRILKRLAEAPVFYEFDGSSVAKGLEAKDVLAAQPRSGESMQPAAQAVGGGPPDLQAPERRKNGSGPWDTFSTRNLSLRVNRRMARDFESDSQKIRLASVAAVTRALRMNPARWTPIEKRALENWSLVLALIPDLHRWSPQDKRDVTEIIRAQAGRNETRYLRLTQKHPRLRKELLGLGSRPQN